MFLKTKQSESSACMDEKNNLEMYKEKVSLTQNVFLF